MYVADLAVKRANELGADYVLWDTGLIGDENGSVLGSDSVFTTEIYREKSASRGARRG